MLQIPLAATPAQTVNTVLNNQLCTFNVYQKFWGLFCDVLVNNRVIIQGVVCQNNNFIVRDLYLGFTGDVLFFDSQGNSDPHFEDLAGSNGGRFYFMYLEPADLPEDYGQGAFDFDNPIDLNDFLAAFPNANLDPPKGGPALKSQGSMA